MAEWMMLPEYADTTMFSESTTAEAKRKWRGFWLRNSSIMLMVLAQLISSLIAVAAKLLQTSSEDYGALDTRQVCAQRGWLEIGSSKLILARFS